MSGKLRPHQSPNIIDHHNHKKSFITGINDLWSYTHTHTHKHTQCLLLKCRPQYGSWRWQPLIAQIPAGKLKAIPPLHGSVQLSKITNKNNPVPYNMRCWKCPPSSTHFWQLLGNVHLHRLIQFPKYSKFYAWYLLSILPMCGGSLHALYFSSAP